ncbi:winged helix-turn-helix transcriptional regulator [Nostoc ellipsosporum NOK]|nr:winged helix-turn-helix transcriptional regulator [Nostoc ellipsosporum NOK]
MEKSIINNVRAFNRYYTNLIGVLDQGYLETEYTLTEARILFEISPKGKIDTSDIIDVLLIDKSYLSRVLKKFEKNNLITKSKSGKDARASQISLTQKGLNELGMLNTLANKKLEDLLKDLPSADKKQLVRHMNSIVRILNKNATNKKL